MDTYATAAAKGYEKLASQYISENIFDLNFWFGGNALHTCLRYLIAANEKDTRGILGEAFTIYGNMRDREWWVDDYGWWGNAFHEAFIHRRALGYESSSYDKLYQNISKAMGYCWEKLKNNWRNKDYNLPSNGGTTDNAARCISIAGGTFNKAPDGSTPPMSGRNCVTNEGFWILTQHLHELFPDAPRYTDYLGDIAGWYERWLSLPKHRQPGILNSNGLVLERPTGNATLPTWYWSGDQGLFADAQYETDAGRSYAVARALFRHNTDTYGVLHENMDFYDKTVRLKTFICDYATGKGIFMRNLRKLVAAETNGELSAYIRASASSVWWNRLPGDQFTFNWNPSAPKTEPKVIPDEYKPKELCDLIMQASGLDALSAALQFASDEEIAQPTAR